MPLSQESGQLAGRLDAHGNLALRWSNKPTPPGQELDLAKGALQRLVTRVTSPLEHEAVISSARDVPFAAIDSSPSISPAQIREMRGRLTDARKEAASVMKHRMLQYLNRFAAGTGVERREQSARQASEPDPTVQGEAFVRHVMENTPAVMNATHRLCTCLASGLDRLAPGELRRVQDSLGPTFCETNSWDGLKGALRTAPGNGGDCVRLHRMVTTTLAAVFPEEKYGTGDGGRILRVLELLHVLHEPNVAVEDALVGAVMAIEHDRQSPDRYPMDKNALDTSIRSGETRDQLAKSFAAAQAALVHGGTSSDNGRSRTMAIEAEMTR